MSKFLDNLFTRRYTITISVIDQDAGEAVIATKTLTGKKGQRASFDVDDLIKHYTDQGYRFVQSTYPTAGVAFARQEQNFEVVIKHDQKEVGPNQVNDSALQNSMKKSVKQIVHYAGAGTRTPTENIQVVNFKRKLKIDAVTNDVVEKEAWLPQKQNFLKIGVPTIPGFVPDKVTVGGKGVAAGDDNQEFTVTYQLNKKPDASEQTAIVEFVDLSADNQIIKKAKLTGEPSYPIIYDANEDLEELAEDGYDLVDRGTTDVQFFGNSKSYVPTIVITVKENKAKLAARNVDQIAIVNFIDLDHAGRQLTSSGPLVGKAGEKITDLYSSAIPIKGLKQAGFRVVFNNFDENGQEQEFNADDLNTQVFTIGLSKMNDQQQQMQLITNSVKDVIAHNENSLSNPVTSNLIGIMNSLLDLIQSMNQQSKGE